MAVGAATWATVPFAAMVIVHNPEIGYDLRDFGAQRAIGADFQSRANGWQTPLIREDFLVPSTSGFYFDSLAPVHMPS